MRRADKDTSERLVRDQESVRVVFPLLVALVWPLYVSLGTQLRPIESPLVQPSCAILIELFLARS